MMPSISLARRGRSLEAFAALLALGIALAATPAAAQCKRCAGPEITGPSGDDVTPGPGADEGPGTDPGTGGGDEEPGPGDGESAGSGDDPQPAAPQADATPVRAPGGNADAPGMTRLSEPNTDRLTILLARATATCGGLADRYRIDCLRVHYISVARQLPRTGDYEPIRAALIDAARQLDAIVEANLDPAAPKLRPRVANKPAAPRLPKIRAVRPEAEAAALAAAERVVAETAAVILRSGEDPTRRTAHYMQVAEAVGTNLVILRSA